MRVVIDTNVLLTSISRKSSSQWLFFSIQQNKFEIAYTYHKLNIVEAEKDDNKFIDCAFAANAGYLVTEDNHFNVLKRINFPSIKVVNTNIFKQVLIESHLLNHPL